MNKTVVWHFVVLFDNPSVVFTVFLLSVPIVAVLIMVCLLSCKICSMMYRFEEANRDIELNSPAEYANRATRHLTIAEELNEIRRSFIYNQ